MAQLSQTELSKKLQALSPELREALFSENTANNVFEIAKKHGLLVDKMGEMSSEIGNLMLGVTHPDEFVGNLAERLQVDKTKAKAIADDINREIFTPVRQHLRAMFGGIGNSEPAAQSVSLPTSNPPQAPEKYKGVGIKYEGKKEEQFSPKSTASSLEDLEAELKKTIAEEHGSEPLSIVKPAPTKPLIEEKIDVPRYTGSDPYREPIESTIPNTKGAPYVPSSPDLGQISAPTMNYGKKEEKPTNNHLPFSPLSSKTPEQTAKPADPYREKAKEADVTGVNPNGTLKAFRGFNMNDKPQGLQPEPQPAKNIEKPDPYKEPVS